VLSGWLPAGLAAVILAALAGLDRVAAVAAARAVAARIALAADARTAPGVRISGVAFLPRLLTGRYRRIDVALGACTLGGVGLSWLTARLGEVRAPLPRLRAGDGVRAGELTATAMVPLAALTGRLPAGLALRLDGGDVRISGTIRRVPVAGTLGIKADTQKITFTPKVAGVSAPFGFALGLPELWPELAITGVRVTGEGLEVVLRGTDVRLPAGRR
jgi:hypothetical protein